MYITVKMYCDCFQQMSLVIDIFDYSLFWNFSLILPDLLNEL